jgi:hypothetical protein
MILPEAHHGAMTSSSTSPITIRRATDDDAKALDRLARLDSQRLPAGPHLIALVDAVPVAAVSLSSGRMVANPFASSESVVELLHERAGHLTGVTPPMRGVPALSLLRGLFPAAPRPRAYR